MDALNTPLKSYYPHLDSFRAFAVLFVLFHHFWNQDVALYLPFGNLGVDGFFTLSGFLITSILLKYKASKSFSEAISTFYMRRFLRIFPLYYFLILLACILFRYSLFPQQIPWVALYGLNFYQMQGLPVNVVFSQFWSLCVEEQFYLVWPFVILLLPKTKIKPFIVFSIIGSILFSLIYRNYTNEIGDEYWHTLSCVQALGIGSLLAVFANDKGKSFKFITQHNRRLMMASILGVIISFILYKLNDVYVIFVRTSGSFTAFFVITRLVFTPINDRFRVIMSSRALQFIGRISYGIYVYRMLVKMLFDPFVVKYLPFKESYLVTFPVYSIITIGISYLSFKYFEKPINDVKDKGYILLPFEYRLNLSFLKSLQ